VVGSELPRILGISVGADRIGWMNDPATAAQDVKQVLATASFPSHPSKRMSKRTVAVAMVRDAWLTVEHGQPLKRGRSVWEQVVPWKRWWMPGADEVTTLTTSRPLIMNGLYVPRGTFSLYCILGEKLVFILNHRLGQHHKVYDPSLDLGRVPTIRQELDVSNELLTFAIVPTRLGGELKISWDRRLYSVPFEVMR
jgi:hypothetical protein